MTDENTIEAREAVQMAGSNLEAMGDGHRARCAMQPLASNPWPQYRPERENWEQGWKTADRLLGQSA